MELQTFLERYHLRLDPQQQAAVAGAAGPRPGPPNCRRRPFP